jgi:mitochondrial FAD-linked sulfhydryl oxidase
MDPGIWGPSTWMFLHLISISYPEKVNEEHIKKNKNFINAFKEIIPCKKCKNHFKTYLENENLDENLKSRNNYMKFIWRMHNNANSITDKPTMDFEKFITLYQEIIDMGEFNPIKIYQKNKFYMLSFTVIFFILTIILIYILYQFTKKRR